MHFLQRDSVRAFLPAVALAVCLGGARGEPDIANNVAATSSTSMVAGNRAPTIANAGAQVAHVGVPFEFRPAGQDTDGDALTYSAENLPPWARLDAATGQIVGTPTTSDMGEYEAITITVADASHHVVTPPFDITVVGPGSAVASLAWEKPASKVDGSPLDDLAGYRIVYGHSADDMDQSVFIGDPEQLTYDFTTLSSGTWYFAVIGVSADGLEGPATPASSKVI